MIFPVAWEAGRIELPQSSSAPRLAWMAAALPNARAQFDRLLHGLSTHLTSKTLAGNPRAAQIAAVIDAVRARLDVCRALWWNVCATVCLNNKRVAVVSGILTLATPSSGVVLAHGLYDAMRLGVSFTSRQGKPGFGQCA